MSEGTYFGKLPENNRNPILFQVEGVQEKLDKDNRRDGNSTKGESGPEKCR